MTAGQDADVDIGVLSTPDELRRLVTLFNQVWGSITPIVGVELLRAISHGGGYVAAASHDDQIVGGSLGFLARHDGAPALHSHVTGILPGLRQTGLGRALKRHQRAWAAEHGLAWVTWTFDPLVRRNAWFNLHVLRAVVDAYLVDFYGPIDDTINHRDESDRLLVAWPTSGELPAPAEESADGTISVATPDDIVVLRRTDAGEATAWRHRVRAELGGALAAGGRVVGFSRDGCYLVQP
ncbi:MAG: GNAT family N-acetyltransferase [Acidimicrobiia bacterium]|nr:GNAT family N-acetyltransferase [Acidimicrobiia bacterium]